MEVSTAKEKEIQIRMETNKDLFSVLTSTARYHYEGGTELQAGSIALFLSKEKAQELVNKINEVLKE